MDKALTTREERYAQLVADGMRQQEAYAQAYSVSMSSARKKVKSMWRRAHVRARVRELQEENAKVRALTRERKRELLQGIAEDESADVRARISAIQVDNAMTGDNEPVKFAHSGSVSLLIALDQVRNGD